MGDGVMVHLVVVPGLAESELHCTDPRLLSTGLHPHQSLRTEIQLLEPEPCSAAQGHTASHSTCTVHEAVYIACTVC